MKQTIIITIMLAILTITGTTLYFAEEIALLLQSEIILALTFMSGTYVGYKTTKRLI